MKSVNLWPENFAAGSCVSGEFVPTMEIYTLDTDKAIGAVVICPGGGYAHRAPHEGKDIALRFNKLGFHAFVIQYRVSPNRFPSPQQDVFRAIKLVRANADKWKVKSDKIAVCGFSAGGHLAASSGTVFDEVEFTVGDASDVCSQVPNALILCYPVITYGEHMHEGSFKNLLGEEKSKELGKNYSLDKRITAQTPPTFLWHTAEDQAVPVENSLLFALELQRHKVPFELHVFPKGRHGLGLGVDDDIPELRVWPDLCATWLKKMNW